ncbi:MAG TPA: hypothetical protein VK173_11410, partial [Lacibacter sp.]|nr:hypothetical protein [Lacibacter sp.]
MEIKLTVLDNEGTEIHLKDIVVIEFANPNIKYIGVVEFNEEQKQLLISDNDGGWHAFPKHEWETFRAIADEKLIPVLEKYFGRSEFTSKAATKRFMQNIEELIHDLSISL